MARIAIVTNSFSGGGAERAMNILANELESLGNQVTLIALNTSLPDSIELKCQAIEIGREWRGSISNTFRSWLEFKKVMNAIKPEISILNCDLPEFFGAITRMNTKLIAVEHVNHPWRTRLNLGRLIRFILWIKKTTWIAVSEHLSIWPMQAKPSKVIYNPILPAVVNECIGPSKIERLVFLGRMTYQKNPQKFLYVAANSHLPILVIGDGEEREAIMKLSQDLRIESEFSGWSNDPWGLLRDGDLMLVPSRFEGDGLVVIEAIQRGVPLIISDIPEFRRFELENINYASSLQDYVDLIWLNRENSCHFRVNEQISSSLLKSRNSMEIAIKWENLIRDLLDSPVT